MKEEPAAQFDNSEKLAEIGFAIAYYRKKRRLSQEQLAERLGISRQHMGAIEAPNMHRDLSLDLLLKFPESYKKHVQAPSLPHVLFYGIILLGLRYRSSSEKTQPQYFCI